MKDNKVLVFPRAIFSDAYSLLSWDAIQDQLGEIEGSFCWMERANAELSLDFVQAIPCAFVSDSAGRYCVLRRVENTRADLNRKLSLVVGGHIDESPLGGSFQATMSWFLDRELGEELGLVPKVHPQPVGVIVDNSSVEASRHIAFLHKVTAERVTIQAPEEFSKNSKFSREFMEASTLEEKRKNFDPWSRLLIEELICPGLVRTPRRQFSYL